MLISRILCVVKRGTGGASQEADDLSVDMVDIPSATRSPEIPLGMSQIDEEDERKLRQELWWLQFQKVELLVARYEKMVAKFRNNNSTKT